MAAIERLTGTRPQGWKTGATARARRLVAGRWASNDYYGDFLPPFWLQVEKKTDGTLAPQLVVPYTLDTNDMRFARSQGFPRPMIFTYLRCIAVSTYCMQKQTSGRPCWLRRHLPHPGPARPDAGAATPTISSNTTTVSG
jgi:peptidoglycan/xylan/chitin deacetylase (PgdA/CDA1 family)